MNCPNCQTLCGDADRFCYLCGTPLQELPPKPEKGARWVPILLLVLMAAVGLTAFFATAGNNAPIHAEGSAPWFYVRDGVLYFEEHKYTGSSELTVPGEIAGQTVRSLSDDCFAGCDTLTAVNLPDSLTAIGKGAFRDCMALRGMDIPDSVSTIGKEAFSGCSALEAVHIPASVHTIGADAFCARLVASANFPIQKPVPTLSDVSTGSSVAFTELATAKAAAILNSIRLIFMCLTFLVAFKML